MCLVCVCVCVFIYYILTPGSNDISSPHKVQHFPLWVGVALGLLMLSQGASASGGCRGNTARDEADRGVSEEQLLIDLLDDLSNLLDTIGCPVCTM